MANVAEGILELLRVCGVHTIYGVTGDAVFPLFDALAKQGEGGIRFIGATDETAAAFMASYHAKLTGELGVCVASSGPGAGNLVNGLADAYFDGAPVLALTGQVASPANPTNTVMAIAARTADRLLERLGRLEGMVRSLRRPPALHQPGFLQSRVHAQLQIQHLDPPL